MSLSAEARRRARSAPAGGAARIVPQDQVFGPDVFDAQHGRDWPAQVDPTTSAAWLGLWYRAFGRPGDPVALAGGAALALTGELRAGARVLRSATNGQNQRCRPGPDPTAAEALLAALEQRGGWDMLHLQGLPLPWAEALLAAAKARRMACAEEHRFTHLAARIEDAGAYLAARSKSTFKRRAKSERALARLHALRFEEIRDPGALPGALRDYVQAERASWKASGGELLGDVPENLAFYQGLCTEAPGIAPPPGGVRLFFLRADERIIAGLIGLQKGGRLVLLKMFFDAGLGKYSPGAILLERIVQSRLSEDGARSADSPATPDGPQVIDFYSGKEAYAPFTNGAEHFADVVIWARGPRAGALRLARTAMQRLRRMR